MYFKKSLLVLLFLGLLVSFSYSFFVFDSSYTGMLINREPVRILALDTMERFYFGDPNVRVEIEPPPEGAVVLDNSEPLVIVDHPFQSTTSPLAGQPVEFTLPIRVNEGVKIEKIKIFVPPGSSHVNVAGGQATDVRISVIDQVQGAISQPGGREIVINKPMAGDYLITFLSQGPYVSEERALSFNMGKKVVVVNNQENSYSGVTFVSSLKGINADSSEKLSVRDSDGSDVPFVSYDVDNDGLLDLIKFKTDVSSSSKSSYDIVTVDRSASEEILDDSLIDDIKIDVDYQDLSPECKQSSLCESYSACIYDSLTDSFSRDNLAGGIEKGFCISDDPSCPPISKKSESCSLGKDISLTVSSQETPSDFQIKSARVVDGETQDVVASIVVRAQNFVDITFSQGNIQESSDDFEKDSCYNAILDAQEEDIDCGGVCYKSCVSEKESYAHIFALISWIAFALLFILFFMFERIFVQDSL